MTAIVVNTTYALDLQERALIAERERQMQDRERSSQQEAMFLVLSYGPMDDMVHAMTRRMLYVPSQCSRGIGW